MKAPIFEEMDGYIKHLEEKLTFLKVMKKLKYDTIDDAIKAQESVIERAKCNIII